MRKKRWRDEEIDEQSEIYEDEVMYHSIREEVEKMNLREDIRKIRKEYSEMRIMHRDSLKVKIQSKLPQLPNLKNLLRLNGLMGNVYRGHSEIIDQKGEPALMLEFKNLRGMGYYMNRAKLSNFSQVV